jgi:hypothetical protein
MEDVETCPQCIGRGEWKENKDVSFGNPYINIGRTRVYTQGLMLVRQVLSA